MLEAFLFDFNATLIRSPLWMDLEIRSLPSQAFAYLASNGHIPPLNAGQLAKAEAIFREARQTANASWRETSHLDDLTAMVEALALQQRVSPQLIAETVATLHRQCLPDVTLIDGAATTLQQLQALGYRLGLISNAAYGPFLSWTLAHFGLLDFFEHVVVSADVGIRKPDLKIFGIALDRMGLAPEETVYVGDDFTKDIAASKKAGMRAIWYRPTDKSTASVDGIVPDAIVTSLNQIPAWGIQWRNA